MCARDSSERERGDGMKRKDKYLVGFPGQLNPVYGNEHDNDCKIYEMPMTLNKAKKMRRKMVIGGLKPPVIFKLTLVKS